MIIPFIQKEALLRKAHTLSSQEKYDESLTVFDRIISLNPRNGRAYLQRALTLMKKGVLDQAEKDAAESVAIQPDNPPLRLLTVSWTCPRKIYWPDLTKTSA